MSWLPLNSKPVLSPHKWPTCANTKATYIFKSFWPPGDWFKFSTHSKFKTPQCIYQAVAKFVSLLFGCWEWSVLDTSGTGDCLLETAACLLLKMTPIRADCNHNSEVVGSKGETRSSGIHKASRELRAAAESGTWFMVDIKILIIYS